MGEEESIENRSSAAAPLIFLIVIAFQFLSRWLRILKKGIKSETEIQLQGEIRQLLKEASTLSQPSTFAQAAKLRRMAAAKEKELANYQQVQGKDIKLSYDMYQKALLIAKVLIYFVLICWFWRVPVAIISQQLVQPFGRLLSWKAGGIRNDNVMVGIIPWLIISSRVSKFVCGLVK